MSAFGFMDRVNPFLICSIMCVQWISQIHLWLETSSPLHNQYGSHAFMIYALVDRHTTIDVT